MQIKLFVVVVVAHTIDDPLTIVKISTSTNFSGSDVEQQYVRDLLLAEAVLLGFIPFLSVILVFLSVVSQLIRLFMIFLQVARWLVTKSKTSQQQQDEPLLSPE